MKKKKCRHVYFYYEGKINDEGRFYRCQECGQERSCFDRRIKMRERKREPKEA